MNLPAVYYQNDRHTVLMNLAKAVKEQVDKNPHPYENEHPDINEQAPAAYPSSGK